MKKIQPVCVCFQVAILWRIRSTPCVKRLHSQDMAKSILLCHIMLQSSAYKSAHSVNVLVAQRLVNICVFRAYTFSASI